jgi:hypothetical protein
LDHERSCEAQPFLRCSIVVGITRSEKAAALEVDGRLKVRPRLGIRVAERKDPEEVLRNAMATRTCITAAYNGGRVKLAPYILYRRDDALFADAHTIERDGRPPREPKLGAFRLAGLTDLAATRDPFTPLLEIDLADERYAGGILAHL